MERFECASCSMKTEEASLEARCRKCGGALIPLPLVERRVKRSELESLPPGVWRYRDLLPRVEEHQVVTLGEGGTPLLAAPRLGAELGFGALLVKDETRNPTGSFIDRGATVLASVAKRDGVRRVLCTTTGNLGASLAAYSAKAGIETRIGIHPNTDQGKLYQMIAYGAKVEMLSHPRAAPSEGEEGTAVTAANHYLLEGEKTTAFEIIQDEGWSQPDAIVLPVGTGGHLTMVWNGLLQLSAAGIVQKPTCSLVGVQLEGSPPLTDILEKKRRRGTEGRGALAELEESDPVFLKAAARAIRDSRGFGVKVSAKEAIGATGELARTEGIFAEPAAASVVAAVRKIGEKELLSKDSRIVCVITGTGLKDTKAISRIARTAKHIVTREQLVIKPVQLGATKVSILRLLRGEPLFGYLLWKKIKEGRSISIPSIYQHLSELEGIDLVRRSSMVRARGRERVIYELTRKGVAALEAAARAAGGEKLLLD
ncbi:MAG: pyridoxal-phosphate dependent enzyme [Thaumarchaeota archaeon]|nr:MAG: pyridoxal-phosphate dependent enzyme [Nitrososphaerota archaeon]